jgi:uncharacterized coiled-coil DUF342 family protein
MKKDVQEAIQFAMNNTLLLADKVNELVDKVAELDDHLAFYAASINQLEMTVKKLSSDFHGTQQIDPYIVNVNQPNWLNETVKDIDQRNLEKALEELTPKNVTDGLKRLYTKADGGRTWLDDINDKVDQMILEKKIRDTIIAKLEKEAEEISCSCGEICAAYDNGFEDAIHTIRNM